MVNDIIIARENTEIEVSIFWIRFFTYSFKAICASLSISIIYFIIHPRIDNEHANTVVLTFYSLLSAALLTNAGFKTDIFKDIKPI